MRRCLAIAAAFTVACTVSASAQQSSAPAPLRGYLIGGGGSSIGLPQSAVVLSGEVAESIPLNLQVYLNASFYDDVMSESARDTLDDSAQVLTAVTGSQWQLTGRDKARSFSMGVKYVVPTSSPIFPYIGGGFGAINVRRVINDARRGDITQAYLAEFGAPDSIVDPGQSNTNHPMGELAGGFGVVIKRAYADIGYRYRKAFHTGADSLNLSKVGVSLGLRF